MAIVKGPAGRSIFMAVTSFLFHDFLAFSFCLRLDLKVNFVPRCSLWQQQMGWNAGANCMHAAHAQSRWPKMEMTRVVEAGFAFVFLNNRCWAHLQELLWEVEGSRIYWTFCNSKTLSWEDIKARSKVAKHQKKTRKQSCQPQQLNCSLYPRLVGRTLGIRKLCKHRDGNRIQNSQWWSSVRDKADFKGHHSSGILPQSSPHC